MNYNIKHKKASFLISLFVLIISIGLPLCFFLTQTLTLKGEVQFNELLNVITEFFKNLDFKDFNTYMIFMLYFFPLVGGIIGLFGKLGRTPNIINFGLNLVSLVSLVIYLGQSAFLSLGLGLIEPLFFNFENTFSTLVNAAFIMSMVTSLLTFINMIKSK